MTIGRITPTEGGLKGLQYVRVTGIQNRVDVIDRSGKVISTDPRKKVTVTVALTWTEVGWLLYDMA